MFRYRLRTLLIALMLLAGTWWGWREWQAHRAAQAERRQVFELIRV